MLRMASRLWAIASLLQVDVSTVERTRKKFVIGGIDFAPQVSSQAARQSIGRKRLPSAISE